MLVAWTGAAAFAASLLYLVYFYLVTLGAADGPRERRALHVVVDVALFSAFALHHSLLARPAVKRTLTRVLPASLERTAYVLASAALVVAMGMLWQPVAGWIYRVDGWTRVLFWLVQGAGVLLVVSAGRALDARELAGLRQAGGDAASRPLEIVGPFRLVRHPIYLGWFLMVWGSPAMTANRALFAAISSLYIILAIPWEERSLAADHGDRYRLYQQRVPWRLLPGLW